MGKQRELLMSKVADHVEERFVLGDDFAITEFKAKGMSIKLESPDYTVTVALKGEAFSTVQLEYMNEMDELTESVIDSDNEDEDESLDGEEELVDKEPTSIRQALKRNK